ncbi:MAG TPA: (Fe-S)-binding protein [Bryobacteraceae bacterium]|jgi:Fe-S oxidoreductase|nr:(Fe-S)-binding protein [Bryobacteraceae bacterium]
MLHPAPLEIVIFLVLFSISLYGFWRRFGPVLETIRRSKPDPDFTYKPVGPRLRKFVWEVLLQGKVIRERPLPGLAHAFVFWGFCAFALITLAHFAAGVGLNLMPADYAAVRAYRCFVALFAIAVAVSIAGLAFRRLVIRPKWLGPKVSVESGFIALLIFLLMATYLVTFGVEEGSTAGRVNWWAHTLTLLIFLPLIPHTKHLHLALSPVTIFFKRDGFSRIPPLRDDDDFGLDTGKDITQLVALQAYSCVECGRCTEHCPAYNTGKILDPKKIALGVRNYLNDYGAGASEPLMARHISEEAAFQCTTCGACEDQCPVGIQHVPIIIGLRRGAVNTGKWEDEYGTKLFLNLERNGNPMGFASGERQKFLEKSELPVYDGTQEYCLWLGCMGAYDPQGREIVLALAAVLRHLGVTFGVLRKERCNGDPARRLGNDLLFSQLAESNIEHIRQSQVKKMLSICPHCVRTISEDWREAGAAFEIEHHSRFLARVQSRLPRTAAQGKVVFHDPCYLGRYTGEYEEPRQVAGMAGEVIDPPRARNRSRCCGAGGGLAFLGEEKGKRVNVDRAEELVATGAEVVGAACPFCHTMFRDALAQVSQTPPKLLDIAQIAAASLNR